MKKFNKISFIILTVFFMFGLFLIVRAAATLVILGAADNFAILAGSTITNTGSSVIDGDVGLSPGSSIIGFPPGTVNGTIHIADTAASQAKTALTAAYVDAAGQTPATTTPSELGSKTLYPDVYTSDDGKFGITGTLTLNGGGDPNAVFIFKTSSTLITENDSIIKLENGANACNIFWQVGSSATLGTNSTFKGNILAMESITLTTGANVEGQVLARTSAVTLDSNTITGCSAGTIVGEGQQYGHINVVKTVINDNGGTKTVADFPLFVNGNFVASGITNRFGTSRWQAYEYKVTETSDPHYTRTFSGDCDANGIVMLNRNETKFCIITNNDIGAPMLTPPVPPLIDVVKVPSPLSLPNGPGLVNYTYTLRNIGTVPVTDLTMVGDTCSPIVLATGDTNADAKLDLNETWVYRCSTTLSETHTNTVVATGWANGLSATDIASATVIVGAPIVPPLIHVTKVPSPLALLAGGGVVTYTEKITNPGTVALSNVKLVDDKCAPMKYISGDTNGDSKLDSSETWIYTCKSNLTKTTTNTAVASGEANGLTVRDFAIATVVVASIVPGLPNTGFTSGGINTLGIIMLAGALILFSTLFVMVLRKNKV